MKKKCIFWGRISDSYEIQFFCNFESPAFDKDNASLPDQQRYNGTIFKKDLWIGNPLFKGGSFFLIC